MANGRSIRGRQTMQTHLKPLLTSHPLRVHWLKEARAKDSRVENRCALGEAMARTDEEGGIVYKSVAREYLCAIGTAGTGPVPHL